MKILSDFLSFFDIFWQNFDKNVQKLTLSTCFSVHEFSGKLFFVINILSLGKNRGKNSSEVRVFRKKSNIFRCRKITRKIWKKPLKYMTFTPPFSTVCPKNFPENTPQNTPPKTMFSAVFFRIFRHRFCHFSGFRKTPPKNSGNTCQTLCFVEFFGGGQNFVKILSKFLTKIFVKIGQNLSKSEKSVKIGQNLDKIWQNLNNSYKSL